jgi:hypothetical protein
MVLKYDAYNETLERQQQKESEVQTLQEKYDADIALLKEAMLDMQRLIKNPEKLAEISRTAKQESSL